MTHLRRLAEAGLTTVHLLPTFDIATIEENRSAQVEPEIPADAGPASPLQQEAVLAVADRGRLQLGLRPVPLQRPEGSYATDPQGTTRIVEYREMVQSLKQTDLGVVVDVVYNHTAQAGQGERSVLDKVVPGYYHRLLEDGSIATSTCCQNTATEHAMMEKLMVDSVVLWATEYKVDGFRFDLMGHHSKANMLAGAGGAGRADRRGRRCGRQADLRLRRGLELRRDRQRRPLRAGHAGQHGRHRHRDVQRPAPRRRARRRPLRREPASAGLRLRPVHRPERGPGQRRRGGAARAAAPQHGPDQGRSGRQPAGLPVHDRTGSDRDRRAGGLQRQPRRVHRDPQENILYVDKHDNETLFDSNAFKLPQGTPMADRVRMQQLALSTVALGQGVAFFHAGSDMLRSKSLDRNSYNSGDHFNVLDFSYETNNFGVGLPPAPDNQAKWPYMIPLLEDPALKPGQADIEASVERFRNLLTVAQSSPLFSLTTAEQVQEKLSYLDDSEVPGLIVMHLDDTVGEPVDPQLDAVVTVFNATDAQQVWTAEELADAGLVLSPVQAGGADPVVKGATFVDGTFTVPARTTAVFVEPTAPASITVEAKVRGVVNPKSRGVLKVTILSQDGFDPVADVDVDSLRVGVTGDEDSVVGCRAGKDVDRDGVMDLVCTVRVSRTGLASGDTQLLVTGTTVGGAELDATVSIRTTPASKAGGARRGVPRG
jgi:hypothetical protein